LTSAEARLASLDMEKAALLKKATEEAEEEKEHILRQTELEIEKIREQAEITITRLIQQTRAELRRFSAEESVRLAEEKLRGDLNAESDAKLVKASIQEIGGLN
jgi:F-type H+-transporting ATPase subunit b